MNQDFSNKISICVRKDLPEWQALNAAAHIACYFGNKLGANFSTGQSFITADGVEIPRNTQYGIAILRADQKDLRRVTRKAREAEVEWMGFTREMIDFSDDEELQEELGSKNAEEVEYLAVGMYGNRGVLEVITKGVQAWK